MSKVEWKKIDEICTVLTGGDAPIDCVKGQTKSTDENPYPIYSNGDDVYGFCSTYRVGTDAVTISSIGNVGSVYYRAANFTPIIRLKVVIPLTQLLDTKFLYYSLLDYSFIGTNSSLSSMKAADIKRIKIPIPALEEQNRIVGILDTFTASIDNLKEQIALRRKQYEYYRDQLLDLEGKEGVQKLQLSSIASIKVGPFGSLIHKNDYIDGGIPLVNPVQMSNGFILKDESFSVSEEMAKKLSSYTLSTDDIVFARRGEIGRCAIVTERENHYICGTGSLVVRFTEKVNSKFMLYMFNSPRCKSYLLKSAIGGSMLNINCDIVGKMPIIIPSPSIQNKIVNILDTFEASIQNLEAQLAGREKQYEYYRNKLLTFE